MSNNRPNNPQRPPIEVKTANSKAPVDLGSADSSTTKSPTDSEATMSETNQPENTAPVEVPAVQVADKTEVAVEQPSAEPATPTPVQRTPEVRVSQPQPVKARSNTLLKPPSLPMVTPKPARNIFRPPNPLSPNSIADEVRREGSSNLAILYEKLSRLDDQLSQNTHTTEAQAAEHMESLYRIIVNTVEREQDEFEFANHWRLIMRMVTESPKGGLLPNRVWRGKPMWSLGPDRFTHFEALMNLIDASVRYRKEYTRFVHEEKVLRGFKGSAQGRLGLFYRTFGNNE